TSPQEKPSVLSPSSSSMQQPLLTQPILSPSSYFQTQAPLGLPSQIQVPFVLPSQQFQTPLFLSPLQLPSQAQTHNWSQLLQPHQPLFANPYNPYQTLSLQTQTFQPNSYVSPIIPTMAEFLKEIDKREETGHYYQDFLGNFEAQRISVKQLQRLTDERLDQCGVNTIGARETIREYAEKYISRL
ncbi:18017_t:CDS:1, partial [Cetraspora pellucida]